MSRSNTPRPDAIATIYTPRERFADGCVHVLGVGGSVIAVAALIIHTAVTRDSATLASISVYGLGAVTVFVMSALYNMDLLPSRRQMMRRLDHAAIFIKIAGTYTPFAALSLGGGWGAALLSAVWSIAAIGVPLQLFAPKRLERAAVLLYLLQGWMVLIAIEPLAAALPADAMLLLFIGGGLYTAGVAFHLAEWLPYHNAIWHAFVLAASGCMYAAVVIGVAG